MRRLAAGDACGLRARFGWPTTTIRPSASRPSCATNDWRSYHAFSDGNFVYDPDLLWRPKPGCPAFEANGFIRADPLPRKKAANEYRIFAIGDSNTAGWYDDSIGGFRGHGWPRDLEELVAASHPRSTVINAGVWGYSSFQGLGRFKEILAFEPDMVLISFGANDAHLLGFSDRDFTPAVFRSPVMKFRLGELAAAAWHQVRSPGGRSPGSLVPRVSVEQYRANLGEIIRICRERGIRCVLLTRPFIGDTPEKTHWRYAAPNYVTATIEVGESTATPVVDIYSSFEGKAGYFRDECHFTEAGHRLAAKAHLRPAPALYSIK